MRFIPLLMTMGALLATERTEASEQILQANNAFLPTGEINDRAILGELNRKILQLRNGKATAKGADLLKQLSRKEID